MEAEATTTRAGHRVLLPKSTTPTGTFDEDAFQVQVALQVRPSVSASREEAPAQAPTPQDLQHHEHAVEQPHLEEALVSSEPLTVPLFDGLGYHCVPHCGVYAQDDYEPALPFVLLSLPYELLQRTLDLAGPQARSLLPHRLWEELTGPASPWFATESSSFYLMVHPIPSMKECQHFMCDSRREINVITHTWTLPDVQFTPELEVETDVDVGLFGASGVEETHMNMQDSKFNGLPFNRMERRAVIIHWQSFSPLNAQIRLSENLPWHSFFLVSRHWPTSRQCVSYHIVIESDDVCRRAREAVAKMTTLGELLDFFRAFGHGGDDLDRWDYDPFAALTRIVEHCLDQVKATNTSPPSSFSSSSPSSSSASSSS